jgi:NTE family protein
MRALVLSGAGNFGALQAGALEPLFETGFRPELIVGTSAGALNGILLASDPTAAGARHAQQAWSQVSLHEIGMPGLLASVRRLATRKDSLLPNIPLARFVARSLGMDLTTFGELQAVCGVRVRAMAVCMETGELIAFGDRETDRILDGAMSSTALPPYLPPWRVGGRRYLDGGVLTKLPLLAAIERGATQIVALNVTGALGRAREARGMLAVAGRALSLANEAMTQREIDLARLTGAEIHLLDLEAPEGVAFWDFSQSQGLREEGRKAARAWLDSAPLRLGAPWRAAARVRMAGLGRRLERLASNE